MSYALTAYLVDLDRLRSVIGSRDETLAEAIIETNSEEFDDADEYDTDDYLPLVEALRQLINGDALTPREYTQYGYALEELCRYLGKPLDSIQWSAARWSCIEATGLTRLLTEVGPPVQLPPKTDFPAIGYLTRDEIKAELERATALKNSTPAEGVIELLDEYCGWLQKAIRRKRDIILFYG